jgi:hypothetical protein
VIAWSFQGQNTDAYDREMKDTSLPVARRIVFRMITPNAIASDGTVRRVNVRKRDAFQVQALVSYAAKIDRFRVRYASNLSESKSIFGHSNSTEPS